MQTKSAEQVKQIAKRMPKEQLETSFLWHWTQLYPTLPPPVRQYPIQNPSTKRDWKLDFCWPDSDILLGVEIQGGSWMKKGGHNTATGQEKDYWRHNELVRMGWRILYYNTPMCKHMARVVDQVAEILCTAQIIEPAGE